MIHFVQSEPGKEPNQWKVRPFVDVGTDELFQARFMEMSRLFDATSWYDEKRKSITDAFWSMVLEGYTPAFLHLRQAIKLSSNPATPILNLRTEYNAFYSQLWAAYKHKFAAAVKAMDYDIDFLFDKESVFENKGKQFIEQHHLDPIILKSLAEDRKQWHNKLAKIRNKIVQHPTVRPESVSIIYQPSTAQTYFDNCWQAAEWFIARLISQNVSGSFVLVDLPANQTNNGRKIYGFQVKPGTQFVR